MGRKKKIKISSFEKVEIEKAVGQGQCLAHTEHGPLFVSHAAPGDVADVRVINFKKKAYYGKISNLLTPSPLRIEPTCAHFGTCGGCKWQHIGYDEQLKIKNKEVEDQLNRVGKQTDFETLPIMGCDEQFEYRNKIEMTFSETEWTPHPADKAEAGNALGFHVPGRFDWVADISKCHLMPDPANKIQRAVKEYALANDYSFFHLKTQVGLLRTLLIRRTLKGDWMVLVAFTKNDKKKIKHMMEMLKEGFPEITSLLYVVNQKKNDTLEGLDVVTFAGDDFITESIGDLNFKIQAQSFFQTNTKQAKNLYDITKDFADLKGDELVYDLYTGTGSIAMYLADKASKVVGVEYVQKAIDDAHENAELNKIDNCVFYAGDLAKVLTTEFMEENGKPNVIVTDPPRSGMHQAVIDKIKESGAERLVYVSCNPGTQARDILLLSEAYKLIKVQPIDMFPHTHHIENVALLIRNKDYVAPIIEEYIPKHIREAAEKASDEEE